MVNRNYSTLEHLYIEFIGVTDESLEIINLFEELGKMINTMKFRKEKMEKEMEFLVENLFTLWGMPRDLGEIICMFTWDIERLKHENWKDLNFEKVDMEICIFEPLEGVESIDVSPMRKFHMEEVKDGFRGYINECSECNMMEMNCACACE